MTGLDPLRRALSFHLRLASRNLWRQGARTTFTLSAIVLGVGGLILARGFVEDIFVQLGEATIHSQLGHVQISRRGFAANGVQHPLDYLIDDPSRVIAQGRRPPAVREVVSRLSFSALLGNGQTDLAVGVEGVEPDREALVATFQHVLSGRRLGAKDADGIYVGEGVAKTLRLRPGQQVTLSASTKGGALNVIDLQVVGIFRSYSKEYDARSVEVPLAAAQELLDTSGVNSIVLLLSDTAATDPVAAALRDALRPSDLEVRTWKQLSDFYTKTVALFERQFGFLELVILVLIVLSVLNTFNLSLFERRGEFGTMRAIGNRNHDVFALIMTEGLILGALGSALGALIGILLAISVSAVGIPMPPPPNAELGYVAQIRLTPSSLTTAIAIGVVASIVAAMWPGLRVSRMPIVDALRQNV